MQRRAKKLLFLDIDNTIAETGGLLARGWNLHAAANPAEPIGGVLQLVAALRLEDPKIAVCVLSARPCTLRRRTKQWLARNWPGNEIDLILLVSSAGAKKRYWRFAREHCGGAIIVDDLCVGHETGDPHPNQQLLDEAKHCALSLFGPVQIEALKRDPGGHGRMVARYLAACAEASPTAR